MITGMVRVYWEFGADHYVLWACQQREPAGGSVEEWGECVAPLGIVWWKCQRARQQRGEPCCGPEVAPALLALLRKGAPDYCGSREMVLTDEELEAADRLGRRAHWRWVVTWRDDGTIRVQPEMATWAHREEGEWGAVGHGRVRSGEDALEEVVALLVGPFGIWGEAEAAEPGQQVPPFDWQNVAPRVGRLLRWVQGDYPQITLAMAGRSTRGLGYWDSDSQTMGLTGGALSESWQIRVVLHEVGHVACGHAGRGGKDVDRCCDDEIAAWREAEKLARRYKVVGLLGAQTVARACWEIDALVRPLMWEVGRVLGTRQGVLVDAALDEWLQDWDIQGRPGRLLAKLRNNPMAYVGRSRGKLLETGARPLRRPRGLRLPVMPEVVEEEGRMLLVDLMRRWVEADWGEWGRLQPEGRVGKNWRGRVLVVDGTTVAQGGYGDMVLLAHTLVMNTPKPSIDWTWYGAEGEGVGRPAVYMLEMGPTLEPGEDGREGYYVGEGEDVMVLFVPGPDALGVGRAALLAYIASFEGGMSLRGRQWDVGSVGEARERVQVAGQKPWKADVVLRGRKRVRS